MGLKPTDDHVMLEELPETTTIHLLQRDPNEKKRARVLAVGPGAPSGRTNWRTEVPVRLPMPCKAGDTVLVNGGAGFKVKHEGIEYWFVYGSRNDIIAVIE